MAICCFPIKRFRQFLQARCPSDTHSTVSTQRHMQSLTKYLRQRYSVHVKQDCSGRDAFTQFKQWVQRQRSNVWLGPAFSAFFHVFLKLYPPISRSAAAAALSCTKHNSLFINSLLWFHAADRTFEHIFLKHIFYTHHHINLCDLTATIL